MSEPGATIWRRRVVLMAIVGLLVAVPVTVLVRSGGDEPAPPKPVIVPAVGEPIFDRKLGAQLQLPKGWSRKASAGVMKLRSKDHQAAIAISAPGPAGDADAILQAAVEELRNKYNASTTGKDSKKTVGGLKAKTVILAGSGKSKKLALLASTAPGKNRAYLVEVFSASAGEARVEAQQILQHLHLEA